MPAWTLTLPLLPMSMNDRDRAGWHARHREALEVQHAVWATAIAAKLPRIPRGDRRRSVAVEIVKPLTSRRRDDAANRDVRAKAILDALVHLGYLVDDDDHWLDWQGVTETRGSTGPATIITITEQEQQV